MHLNLCNLCNSPLTTHYSPKENLKDQLDQMMKKVKELEAYQNVIEQIKELERKIEQEEADAQRKEELKKKIDAFQKSVDELDRYEQMKELFKTAEQFGKEMEAMDDKKAFREHTQKIIQMVEEMDNTSAAINEIRQTGLHPSISSGLQAPGTFAPNKTLFQ